MTESSRGRKRVHVAVGVILDPQGRVLVAQRGKEQHLGGLWEFPGGKLEPGEAVEQALYRELQEELAIEVRHSRPLCRIEHNYPDKAVLLDVWLVDSFAGVAQGQEGQPLRWLPVTELDAAEFPQANRLIIRRLQLRDFLAIINLPTDRPASLITPDDTLLRLRCVQKDQYQRYLTTVKQTLAADNANVSNVILDLGIDSINTDAMASADLLQVTGLRGVHAHAGLLATLQARPVPEHLLFGVSCHNQQELARAAALDADYILLSPVRVTASHPQAPALGWDKFEILIRETRIPVYALGGMRPQDLDTARARGARGIAGISMLSALLTDHEEA